MEAGEVAEAVAFSIEGHVAKTYDELGLVLGWGVVCREGSSEYFDLQADSVVEKALLEASVDFMENSRESNEMHRPGERGTVVFAFPMTSDIAKEFNVDTGGKTGLMIGVRPRPDIFEKYRSGEYTGFSIEGEVLPGGAELVR